MSDPWENEEVLKQLYSIEGRPVTEIAEELGTTRYVIQHRVEKFGLFREYDKPQILHHLYIEKGMSSKEIGDKYDRHHKTILTRLRKHNIPVAPHGRNRPPKLSQRPDGYEMWVTHDGERIQNLYHHRLLAVAEYGFDEVARKDVHHTNKIPWDNRRENIEVLTKEDHGRLHGEESPTF